MGTLTAKILSKKEKEELLSYTQKELTVPLISSLFGKTAKKENGRMKIIPPKFDVRSVLTLEAGEYINKKKVETTVGSVLFNKLMIEGMLETIIENGYYNEVINKKGMSKLFDIISEGLMMQKIPVEPNLIKWLKQYEFYGMKLSTIFSPSYSEGLLRQNKEVHKEKEKLLKSTEIRSVKDMTNIEDALVASSNEILKSDSGKTLFDSGARGSFDNDYKNMNLMVGPVPIPGSNGEYDMIKSNYIEGLQKEDLVAAGNIAVSGAYAKAISTADAGYITKQYYAAYQSIQVDEEGTDCGSTLGIDVLLNENNIKKYYFQYALRNGKPVEITSDNKDEFIGKKVLIRSPMFCKGDKICSICAGRRFAIMKIENAGLTAGRIPNTLMNKSMKNFHNTKIKYDIVDIDDLLD